MNITSGEMCQDWVIVCHICPCSKGLRAYSNITLIEFHSNFVRLDRPKAFIFILYSNKLASGIN